MLIDGLRLISGVHVLDGLMLICHVGHVLHSQATTRMHSILLHLKLTRRHVIAVLILI